MITTEPPIIKHAEALVREHYGRKSPLTLTVGILEHGNQYCWGYGQPQGFDYASAIYEGASITKVFTNTLLTLLEQQGKLKRTDPISRYIPECASNHQVSAITLEQLGSHTSGLPRLPASLRSVITNKLNPYEHYSEEYLLKDLLECRLEAPGRFAYSNFGGGLLGYVLTRCTGRRLEELVRDEICRPLFMEDTAFELSPDQQQRFLPVYTANGKEVPHWDLGILAGAGGLRTTARDLLQFAKANVGMGAAAVTAAMKETQQPNCRIRRNEEVGLGWIIRTGVYHDKIHWHNGGTFGSNSFIGFHREKNMAVVVLANNSDFALKLFSRLRPQKNHVDEIGFELLRALTKTID
ncbi:beta-lactamase family protein [Paenibacillus donghaensis]|uniref:serine hydrolase domain-containing protein n=1 Tax=Paenibacillus donghaensis TaxID=414771 RepID=UPI001883F97A|nr:serine hydrolase domain-containing protein [Paenibacillus donghaensis]MBE9916236.1 beta-lactamase family protein [Paenibacillus donghaensis]